MDLFFKLDAHRESRRNVNKTEAMG
ncbi:uncharacterized protein G2W53_003457 [Senna tora]|uniref:Uncharacterized protein n=1 Tax=Senna tora TaxID=362788 RepID=A0A834XBK1_9FABA|nr:uncharacterized protein G2W53_003457 [Senna tora]